MKISEIWKKYHMVIIAGVIVAGGVYLYKQHAENAAMAAVPPAPATPPAAPAGTTSFTGTQN